MNVHLTTDEDLMGHLAMTVTGYFQGIILGWVAGSFQENLVCFILSFYYLLLRTNAFWDRFESDVIDRGHELLE